MPLWLWSLPVSFQSEGPQRLLAIECEKVILIIVLNFKSYIFSGTENNEQTLLILILNFTGEI